jgi:hypothetical protein
MVRPVFREGSTIKTAARIERTKRPEIGGRIRTFFDTIQIPFPRLFRRFACGLLAVERFALSFAACRVEGKQVQPSTMSAGFDHLTCPQLPLLSWHGSNLAGIDEF